jgi:hypothetical protein
MRIFLSFNSKDVALAKTIRERLIAFDPNIQIFFSPASLGAGFWLPRLAEQIEEASAFLLLIGPQGIGPWQEVEYYTAFDRHVNNKRFALVPVIAAGAAAPGLPLLRMLNWVEAPIVTEDKTLHRLIAALNGDTIESATPLWKLVNPYRGLEAMTEDNADYFFGRAPRNCRCTQRTCEQARPLSDPDRGIRGGQIIGRTRWRAVSAQIHALRATVDASSPSV